MYLGDGAILKFYCVSVILQTLTAIQYLRKNIYIHTQQVDTDCFSGSQTPFGLALCFHLEITLNGLSGVLICSSAFTLHFLPLM